MKIIVYNHQDQYALSRKQVEIIKAIMPNEYFSPIQEFHLTHTVRGTEKFEFVFDSKTVHFAFPIKQKSEEIIDQAVTELLVGLARIKAKTKWGVPLKDLERKEYQAFVDSWHPKCISALSFAKP